MYFPTKEKQNASHFAKTTFMFLYKKLQLQVKKRGYRELIQYGMYTLQSGFRSMAEVLF